MKTIKPSPHVIQQPQKNREKPKKKERKVTIFSPEQMYARPPKATQILQLTQHMTKKDKASVIAELFAQTPELNYKKDIAPKLAAISRAKQEKEQKVLKDAEAARKRANHPCYVLLDNLFRTINFHEKGKLATYYSMTRKEIASLLKQLNGYRCYRRDFDKLRPRAAALLRNILIQRQAEAEPENPKSTLQKITGIFRGH